MTPHTALYLGHFSPDALHHALNGCDVVARPVALPQAHGGARAHGVTLTAPAHPSPLNGIVQHMPDGAALLSDVVGGADILARPARIHLRRADRRAHLARYDANVAPAGARAHCFVSGTRIYTPRGPLPVEDLRVGFPVRTMDYGIQPVRWIGTTLHHTPKNHAPIEISANALGAGFPAIPLRVSPNHRLLLRSAIAERLFGTPEVLLAAKFLLDAPGVRQMDGEAPVRYWHIATARHSIVCANGTWAETLFPGIQVPEGMDASDVSALEIAFEQILSRHVDGVHPSLPPARPILRGASQRSFVARHLKQRRAFIAFDAFDDEGPQAQTG